MLTSLFTQSETHLHIMETYTKVVTTTRTRLRFHDFLCGKSMSLILVSAPVLTLSLNHIKSTRWSMCGPPVIADNYSKRCLGWPWAVCVARLGWKCQRQRRHCLRKRRECRRNTGRNEQLQLKTVPKRNGHIFHPIWDVTNCSQRA